MSTSQCPPVSIVIACYNYGEYLPRCIESVLAQSYPRFDIIIVDDGSSDDTPAVARRFLGPRVRYHRQQNQGQAVAKNAGIRLATGDLVAFLDADDLWEPDKLALQVPLFSASNVGVVYAYCVPIDEHERPLPFAEPQGGWTARRGRVTRWLAFDNFVPFSSSVVRRSLLVASGGFDQHLRMGIDWDLWLRLSCVTDFDFVPQPLMRYRTGHPRQMSRDLEGRMQAADYIFERFRGQHPDALTRADLRKIAFYNACFRGGLLRENDLARSTRLFLRALRLAPWSSAPYVGLARNLRLTLQRRDPRNSNRLD